MRTDLEFHNEIVDQRKFPAWASVGMKDVINVYDKTFNYTVEVMDVKIPQYEYDYDSYGGYEIPPRGWTAEARIIFKVSYKDGEGDAEYFFKKEGSVDSYNGVTWDGKWLRVFPRRKEVVTYEFE